MKAYTFPPLKRPRQATENLAFSGSFCAPQPYSLSQHHLFTASQILTALRYRNLFTSFPLLPLKQAQPSTSLAGRSRSR